MPRSDRVTADRLERAGVLLIQVGFVMILFGLAGALFEVYG